MKKVAIITLNGYVNYGNRLQNFALQEIIRELGYEVETILNNPFYSGKGNLFSRNINKIFQKKNLNPILLKNRIVNRLLAKKKNYAIQCRIPEFELFTKKYIVETSFSIENENIPDKLSSQYDYFVVGSDQIWNPNYHQRENILPAVEYLSFAPREKRLSYAASFGISSINENFIPRVKNGIEGMHSILVREQAGVDIVKELAGRNAYLVLDPTMLLTKDKWLSIAETNINKPKGKYLLTYFLGEMSTEAIDVMNRLCELNNLEIIQLENYKNIELYKANPSHFIDYINSSSIFLTDSFHGVVFSIVLETPFVVFKRQESGPSMYSRIETLLKTFNLENRQNEFIKETSSDVLHIDYSEVREILVREREQSISIFKNSFLN